MKGNVTKAHNVVRALLDRHGESTARVERVIHLSDGLHRSGYGVIVSGASRIPEQVVVLIPRRGRSGEVQSSWEREIGVLRSLERSCRDIDFPKIIGVEWDDGLPILVVSFVAGLAFGPHGVLRDPVRYLESVARVASVVHRLPIDEFRAALSGATTYREFAMSLLSRFKMHSDPDIGRALAWCLERMPGEEPSVVVHGDLLGQNILLSSDNESRLAVIDWSECCLGDPAYEFAVVTRGVRNPWKVPEGRKRLLALYKNSGGLSVSIERVLFYETILVMAWLAHYLEREPSSGDVGEERRRLATVIAGFR